MQYHPETILFVGAGATASLGMPTTGAMAKCIWLLCQKEDLPRDEEHKIKVFEGYEDDVVDLCHLLDRGVAIEILLKDKSHLFPNVNDEDIRKTVFRLRDNYDWGALRLIAKAKRGDAKDGDVRDNYLQEVFTMMDAAIRDERGFIVYEGDERIFLPVYRIRRAYQTLILFINMMFACAWQNQLKGENKIEKYERFFESLARVMQDEAAQRYDANVPPETRAFYQFSYSVVTTNFDPLVLWLIWNAHNVVNKAPEKRIGNPARILKLLMNFPNSLGMRKPMDEGEGIDANVWFPCTDAVAQNVNKEKYGDYRIFRVGKYFPVHGMSVMRHCPMCGRLNLYMGDSWETRSKTLFPNGLLKKFCWGQEPRTDEEKMAHARGEYDALSCHFCGMLTYSYDNFMFMQTQLKCLPPSFIKETTDEALAMIANAKHIVLLGYSLPLDDAIWASLLSMMSRRPSGEKLYCTVVDYQPSTPSGWLKGDDLEKVIKLLKSRNPGGNLAAENAIAVFGKENVRASFDGVPNIFGMGTKKDVRELFNYTNQDDGALSLIIRQTKNELCEADFTEPTMIIKIERLYREGMDDDELYDVTRQWWRVNKNRAEKIRYVLAVSDSIVRKVFTPEYWEIYDGLDEECYKRCCFIGGSAPDKIQQRFVGKSVKSLFPKGAANPIRYFDGC